MANAINSLKLGSGTYVFTTPYATCSTDAAAVAKVATITPGSNFSLETGARVAVKFTHANAAGSPTLNVNNTGAKAIYFKNAALSSSNYWSAGQIVDFIYDGTNWVCSAVVTDTKNTAGATDTASRIYLIGATSQDSNPQTYSHDTVYVETDGCLYSNHSKVATLGDNNEFTGTNTFKTETSGNLCRTLINQNGISVGGGIGIDILTDTTYGYDSIKRFNVSGTYTYAFPNKNGTIALTSDIPDTSNFVTLAGTNIFTGNNKFQCDTTTFMTARGGPNDPITTVDANGVHCQAGGDDGTYYQDTVIRHKVFTLTLPFKSGVLATLDDMPDKPFTAPLRLSASPKLTKSTGLGFRTVHFKGGPTSYTEGAIWTDGSRTYYSYNKNQYVLDPATLTWNAQTWSGLTSFIGSYVWSDGTNIYYSNGTSQYQLNIAKSTWTAKTWSGLTSFKGSDVWSDGVNIYAPGNNSTAEQWVLNKSNSSWSAKTWNGIFTRPSGKYIWSDGTNIYYSDVSITNGQLVLDVSTSTWSRKTWNGTKPHGPNVWTDGTNIYYDASSSLYVLDSAASKWTKTTFGGRDSVDPGRMWTDGTHIYYAFGSVLDEDTSVYCSMKSTG